MASIAKSPDQREFLGHPVGLFILFFTEMWERFSYYGMRAILVLYLVQATTDTNPGLGWSNGEALALYGWYTMLVYVASIRHVKTQYFHHGRWVIHQGRHSKR